MISPQELGRLWREHAAGLELIARTRCAAPEDCVQEAFIRLAAQPIVPTDCLAWLARTVHNMAISHSRTDKRRWRREQSVAETSKKWFEATNIDELGIPVVELEHALQQLDTDLQELIVAHIWGGLSFRQLSPILNSSSSTLHRRYMHALEQLRKRLEVESSPASLSVPGIREPQK